MLLISSFLTMWILYIDFVGFVNAFYLFFLTMWDFCFILFS
nr:MAG TPA: hypothetical protein [Caudoviricetes sp.]